MAAARRAGLLLSALLVVQLLSGAVVAIDPDSDRFTIIPDVKPWPKVKPVDSGYPGNLPAGLPTTLPKPPPVLVAGPAGSCSSSVRDILTKNKRFAFMALLSSFWEGKQVLDGNMAATVLAPPDDAIKRLQLNQFSDPLSQATVASYHVLQGKLSIDQLLNEPGLWLNTTLTKADCPTAFQTLTVIPGNGTAVRPSAEAYVRGAANTARITAADLQACNSVVHLLDSALQPCCTSVFEQLPQFSIVKIQPSYFDGYRLQDPPTNEDASNRRLFEEGMVDLLLYMNRKNATKTLLWPKPEAWGGFRLGDYLPWRLIDSVEKRAKALRVLALYSLSYQMSLLPKDTPAADGTAPGVAFQFQSALHNLTDGKQGLWTCQDSLRVVSQPLTAPVDVSLQELLPPSSTSTALNFDPSQMAADDGSALAPSPSPAASKGGNAAAPAPAPAPAPAAEEPAAAAPAEQPADAPAAGEPAPAPAAEPGPAPAAEPAAAPAPAPASAPAAKPAALMAPAPAPVELPQTAAPAAGADAAAPAASDDAAAPSASDAAAAAADAAAAPAGGNPAPMPVYNSAGQASEGDAAPADAASGLASQGDITSLAGPAPAPAPAPTAAAPAGPGRRKLVSAPKKQQQPKQQQQQRRPGRALLQAEKSTTVSNSFETCESARVLIIDAVPIPCDYEKLVRNYDRLESELEDQFYDPPVGSIASYYYEWLVKNGVKRQSASGYLNSATRPGAGLATGAGAALPYAAAAAAAVAGQLLLL